MEDHLDGIVFSQEAMLGNSGLVFPSYNFGSEPQHTQQTRHALGTVGDSQQCRGAASGYVGLTTAAACSMGNPGCWREQNGKVFSDPIHGTFRLDPINVAIIDTPQFQRLRDLHQLGLTHLVFPGTVHTRFEHSLGTSFKAFEVADRILHTQGRELGMEKDDVKLVSLAGLCHDLGHGPFSHVFEYEFLRRKLLSANSGSDEEARLKQWHHENMSTRILEYLVDENNIDNISQEDIRRISDLIKGDVHEDRGFLFDIVNNKRCGVDVDKVDYLQRDAKMCDVNIGCDFKRLLTLTKVVRNQIAYKWSEYSNIWDLFHARESMHRKVYTHRKTKAVEFMVVDALLEADQALRFSEMIHTAEDFCQLNDSLLNTIENFNVHRRLMPALNEDAERCLLKAQNIIKRLRRRDLYRYGNQFVVPYEYLEDSRWESMSQQFTAEEVVSCYRGGGDVTLRPEDVIVSRTKIDFTQGGRNPLDRVLFFDGWDDELGRYTDPYQVVGILPRYHQEVLLRVYTPRSDPRYQQAISDALGEWCRRRFGSKVQMATPARGRLPNAPLSSILARETAIHATNPRRGPPQRLAPPSGCGTAVTNCNTTDGIFDASGTVACSGVLNGAAAGEYCGSNGGALSAVSGRRGDGGAAAVAANGGSPHAYGLHVGAEDAAGTPTRSTPFGSTDMRLESDATAAGTVGRSKRPRSSASLFQDLV